MKANFFLSILFLPVVIISFVSGKQVNTDSNKSRQKNVFAVIKNNSFVFKADTLDYKTKVRKALFPKEKWSFNKISIIKQLTLGDKKEFYYILLTTKDGKIKVGKWLNKNGETLSVNDEIADGDLFEQSYLSCVGDGSCYPQVYQEGSQKMWGCSEDIKCYIDGKQDVNCQSYKSILGY